MLKGFREFIIRGNVVDLAVGIVIGAAFQDLVKSFVSSFITPLVGMATRHAGDFNANGFTIDLGFGQVLFPYGLFITAALTFLIVAVVVYFVVVLPINAVRRRMERAAAVQEAVTLRCPECLSEVPTGARRCAACTSVLPTESAEATEPLPSTEHLPHQSAGAADPRPQEA